MKNEKEIKDFIEHQVLPKLKWADTVWKITKVNDFELFCRIGAQDEQRLNGHGKITIEVTY